MQVVRPGSSGRILMPRYLVVLTRVEYHQAEIEVEADNEDFA